MGGAGGRAVLSWLVEALTAVNIVSLPGKKEKPVGQDLQGHDRVGGRAALKKNET